MRGVRIVRDVGEWAHSKFLNHGTVGREGKG